MCVLIYSRSILSVAIKPFFCPHMGKNHIWHGNIDAINNQVHSLEALHFYQATAKSNISFTHWIASIYINRQAAKVRRRFIELYWQYICMCKYTRFVASFQPYVYTFLSLFSPCIHLSLSLFSLFFRSFFVPSNWRVYFSQWFPQSEPLHVCVYVLSALKKCDQFNFIRLTISRSRCFDWANAHSISPIHFKVFALQKKLSSQTYTHICILTLSTTLVRISMQKQNERRHAFFAWSENIQLYHETWSHFRWTFDESIIFIEAWNHAWLIKINFFKDWNQHNHFDAVA